MPTIWPFDGTFESRNEDRENDRHIRIIDECIQECQNIFIGGMVLELLERILARGRLLGVGKIELRQLEKFKQQNLKLISTVRIEGDFLLPSLTVK